MDHGFDPLTWIEQHLAPSECDTTAFVYDHVESQSGRCLPIIYQPFDARSAMHFADRGWILDFALSTGGGRVLDFGPGDGWPSLMLAPLVDEVVGVDASVKRVEVCRANADRLGTAHASFVHVPAGKPLPFDDAKFDSVVAASSVEQTPDPRGALAELHRVLKPGGRLRMHYEALGRYRGGQERDVHLWRDQDRPRHLLIYDRRVDDEWAKQYRLTLDLAGDEVEELFARHGEEVNFEGLQHGVLQDLSRHVTSAASCSTTHPAGRTWELWLQAAGFRAVQGTQSGGRFARQLFDKSAAKPWPDDPAGVDAFLRPLVEVVIGMPAPLSSDPMLTAVK